MSTYQKNYSTKIWNPTGQRFGSEMLLYYMFKNSSAADGILFMLPNYKNIDTTAEEFTQYFISEFSLWCYNHKIFYLFIYLWLCWVFVYVRGLSLVGASGGHSSTRCAGLSLTRPLLLRSTGSRRAGSVIVAYGLSCSAARGIFPDQGSNPCPLH